MSDLNEVLISMEEVQTQIKNAELLEQLHRSPAFKRLVLEGYFKTEAIQLVGMKAHPTNEQTSKSIDNKMIGISAFQAYLNSVYRKGETAKAALLEHEQTIEEISREEV